MSCVIFGSLYDVFFLYYNIMVDIETIEHLLELNRRFYQTFGGAFAATRRRIQTGVKLAIDRLPDDGIWLDIGCGSGALAQQLLMHTRRRGRYVGLDFSSSLLEEARKTVAVEPAGAFKVEFLQADLSDPTWEDILGDVSFDVVLAFAVLHHLPGFDLRVRLMRQIREHLSPAGCFIHSEWQFQHSERLMARRVPWNTVGIADQDVETGDTLLDWRSSLPGQKEKVGLRYVHLFTRAELLKLAETSGFKIVDEFESDGKGGRLGLYQVWR
ncbi:MAG: class I SAM-dependent methyltransferase, partial [Anaerolineaceae bacterium]|nr:class I SAM-dependent methyltransferase [Anaerolineaceae bacterium]